MIDRIREASSIVDLASATVELRGSGNRMVGNCPYHADTNASLTIYVDQNSWYCYGCKRGGSPYDWVMERDKCSFHEAGVTLSNACGIPWGTMTEEEREDHDLKLGAYSILAAYADKCHEKLTKNQTALDYLHSVGITDESIKEYRIGFGIEIKETSITEEMHHAGLVKSTSHGLWQPMKGRIVFPVVHNGSVVQMSGRKMPGNTSDKKYISLPDSLGVKGLVPWNSYRLRGERCVLVEGIKDAILLEQAGFAACSTISSLFKAEWKDLLRERTHYLCCYDGDEAGRAANLKVAGMMNGWGYRVSVISLPDSNDPADFVQSEGAGAFQSLVDRAETLTEHMIGRLPEKVSEHEYDSQIKPIFATMVALPETAKEAYIARLAKVLSAPKPAIRADLQKFSKNGHSRPEEPFIEEGDYQVSKRTTDPIRFAPGQDVVDGVLYLTVYLQVTSGEFLPFVISSKREMFPLSKDSLIERDFMARSDAIPTHIHRWSIGTNEPYNVHDYLECKADADPREVFIRIRYYFKHFLRYPDPLYYDFLALWTMATYHFKLYDAFGYVFLTAIKNSGKSQTMNLINLLAFNSRQADSITEAVLKRLVNADAATLLYDEAEKLFRKSDNDESCLMEVLKGGYTRSGMALSVNKETHKPETFSTYSPKVLANTKGADNILGDRCITLYLQRDMATIPEFVEAERAGRLKKLRNMLYCFTLNHFDGIAETKANLPRPRGLVGRDWQIWQAVLVLAKYLDSFRVAAPRAYEMDDGAIVEAHTLFDRMLLMAKIKREYKLKVEEDTNQELRMMMGLWNYVCEHPEREDWYSTSRLCYGIMSELGWEKPISDTRLAKLLTEDLMIAKRTPEFHVRKWANELNKQQMHWRIDKAMMKEQAWKLYRKELEE